MISIIHPSRSRPKQANETIKKWLDSAFDKSKIEYILSVDKDDKCLRRYKAIGIENGIYVSINRNKSAIEAINNATRLSNGSLIIIVSDDFDCPLHWDATLTMLLEDKEDFIVKTQDGIQPTLITLPIMDRTYYNRFGYVYNPLYKHLWSDTEMTAVGELLGKVITLDILFEHKHHSVGKSKKDQINIKNDKTWSQGKRIFNDRLKINFGIDNPVKDYSDIKWQK